MLLFKLQEKTFPSLKRCWEGAVEAYWARLNAFAAHINDACDVEGICRELPSRAQGIDRRQEDRLAKRCGSR